MNGYVLISKIINYDLTLLKHAWLSACTTRQQRASTTVANAAGTMHRGFVSHIREQCTRYGFVCVPYSLSFYFLLLPQERSSSVFITLYLRLVGGKSTVDTTSPFSLPILYCNLEHGAYNIQYHQRKKNRPTHILNIKIGVINMINNILLEKSF